jgi:inorganic pyrophosphatase
MNGIIVTIETPRHTAGKYIYDEHEQCYKLKKILPLGMYFPYDFGMIQNTKAKDGDPADVIVITECVTYPGVRISCRLIGALQAKQIEKGKAVRNDRYIMVAEDSLVFAHIRDIGDFSGKHNEELKAFFINYARVEDKELKWIRFASTEKAQSDLEKLIK